MDTREGVKNTKIVEMSCVQMLLEDIGKEEKCEAIKMSFILLARISISVPLVDRFRWISLWPGILDFVTHRILWQRFVIIVGYYDQFALSLWVCTRGVHIALLQFQLFPFQTQQYAKLTVQRTWISMTNGPNVRQWALHLRATIWYTYIQMLSERFNALK